MKTEAKNGSRIEVLQRDCRVRGLAMWEELSLGSSSLRRVPGGIVITESRTRGTSSGNHGSYGSYGGSSAVAVSQILVPVSDDYFKTKN